MAAGKLRSKSGGCCWDPGSLECFRRSGLPGEAAEDPHPDRLEPGRQCEGLCIAPFLQTDTTWLLCVALLLAPGASVLETSNLSSDAWQPPQAKPEPTMQLSLRRPENEARKDDPHRAVQRRPSEANTPQVPTSAKCGCFRNMFALTAGTTNNSAYLSEIFPDLSASVNAQYQSYQTGGRFKQ